MPIRCRFFSAPCCGLYCTGATSTVSPASASTKKKSLSSSLFFPTMIMSVHDPMTRKRDMADGLPSTKRARTDADKDQFSEKMYILVVQSALDSLEKVCGKPSQRPEIFTNRQNDTSQINTLTAKLHMAPPHPEALPLSSLLVVLRGLMKNISRLDNSSASRAVMAIVAYPWMQIPHDTPDLAAFLDTYAQFLSVLVSSFPRYLREVISKLISEFSVLPETTTIAYPHHNVLRKFVTYVPTCIGSISPILLENFPHHLSASPSELLNYIRNAIAITHYCPDLLYSVWQMLVECCINLDVELQNELDDLDDDLIEELINEDDDEFDEELPSDADDDDDQTGTEVYTVALTKNIKKLVVKLDRSLHYLLVSTAPAFTMEKLNSGEGVTLFNTLASLFKSHILPTHFTKSIQFLLFHVSQYHPELADLYLVLLIDVAFNPSEIIEKRLKALQYLSSYIARAKNLTKHQVVFMVSYLIGWIDKYITEREHEVLDLTSGEKSTGGMERFKLFYSAFQSLLYIFCFRHQLLTKSAEDNAGEWECDLDKFFQRVIIAKFNPLKYCDETVVYIFAKIATKLNVCYCYSIIEHNKRERMTQSNSELPSSVGNFRHKQEFLDLEAYFPFDPMVLPLCKNLVSENYIEWKDVNPNTDDDEDDESGSHADDDESSDDEEDEMEDDEDEDDEADIANKVHDAGRAVEDSDEEITSEEDE